jgi:hypothetical protein
MFERGKHESLTCLVITRAALDFIGEMSNTLHATAGNALKIIKTPCKAFCPHGIGGEW